MRADRVPSLSDSSGPFSGNFLTTPSFVMLGTLNGNSWTLGNTTIRLVFTNR